MKLYNYDYFLKNVICVEKNVLDEALEERDNNINPIEINKKKGTRTLYTILDQSSDKSAKIKIVQKNLLKNFLYKIPLSSVAKGFFRGGSYNRYLEEHIGANYFLHLDVSHFFDSITQEQVRESLKDFIEEDSKGQESILDYIIDICMLDVGDNKILPQGWITSPAISNIIFRRIDQCILKYCQSIHKIQGKNVTIKYTRYADDLLFSSDYFNFDKLTYFQKMIKNILKQRGFLCNNKKTIVSKDEIVLNGYVLSKDIHLSNRKLNAIHKVIYYFDDRNNITDKFKVSDKKIRDDQLIEKINQLKLSGNGGAISFNSRNGLIQYLCGYRSFLISIVRLNPQKTKKVMALDRTIKKIEMIIDAVIL